MFQKFNMLQNLRALIDVHQLPEQLHPLVAAYSRSFNHDVRGTLLSEDLGNPEADEDQKYRENVTLQREIYTLLEGWVKAHDTSWAAWLDSKATLRRAVFGDVVYKTAECSASDSQVMFHSNGGGTYFDWTVGSVTSIFTHKRETANAGWVSETFLIISPYEPANLNSDGIPWPFQQSQQLSFVPGRLYRRRLLPQILLRLDQILGHFGLADTDYTDGSDVRIFQAIPLNKVCFSVQ